MLSATSSVLTRSKPHGDEPQVEAASRRHESIEDGIRVHPLGPRPSQNPVAAGRNDDSYPETGALGAFQDGLQELDPSRPAEQLRVYECKCNPETREHERDHASATPATMGHPRDNVSPHSPSRSPNPTELENLHEINGRGILIARFYLDKLKFNKKGNEVTLIKYKSSQRKKNAS